MITFLGDIDVDEKLIEVAHSIKHLNYKTTTPTKFRKNLLTEDLAGSTMDTIAELIRIPVKDLDYVYFSVCQGAEPHVDQLDPEKFTSTTYVIPVILPEGNSVIWAEDEGVSVHIGGVYEFNHEKLHGMVLDDTESGCVVIMVAIKK